MTPAVQYPGACCYVMRGGNSHQDIFINDGGAKDYRFCHTKRRGKIMLLTYEYSRLFGNVPFVIIGAPGAFHHIIIREIERKIFLACKEFRT